MNANALIFDLDDTLFREKDYVFSGFMAVDKWLYKKYKIVGFYNQATQLFKKGIQGNVFNRTLDTLNIDINDELIRQMVKVYREHEPFIELLEDARWVLNNLSESLKLGLISDGYLVAQERKIKALKIDSFFHSIILSDTFGRESWKPSPVPYIKASVQLNVPHNECIYIGDNLSKDFITAKKLGWKTVHINRKEGVYSGAVISDEYKAHYQIQDLRELVDIEEVQHMFKS